MRLKSSCHSASLSPSDSPPKLGRGPDYAAHAPAVCRARSRLLRRTSPQLRPPGPGLRRVASPERRVRRLRRTRAAWRRLRLRISHVVRTLQRRCARSATAAHPGCGPPADTAADAAWSSLPWLPAWRR
eukprot:365353-Chlamydomonas_euryale.AAC.13